MQFKNFGQAVAKQFAAMEKAGKLFRVSLGKDDKGNDITKDALWAHYLASYPAGSDPIYKVRTEHDCNCCKQFIRAVGNVVSIQGNKVVSIWDVAIKGEPEYQVVADAMAAKVKTGSVCDVFFHTEASAGSTRTFHDLVNGVPRSWDHFHVTIPRQYVVSGKDMGPTLNEYRGNHDVMLRSLKEFDHDTVDTVLELMSQNSLYRGKEYEGLLKEFKKMKNKTNGLSDEALDLFVWNEGATGALSRIRNGALGTLLIDLAGGMDLDGAVRRWEVVMAPANFKRTTALVTKKMVEDARKKIAELGLTSALERRYAKLSDISINDLLFANRNVKSVFDADVFDSIATKVSTKKTFDGVEEVSLEKFIADILPKAQKVEVMLDNRHKSNFVSLIAPADPTAENLFKWDNKFSWSYVGDFTDSGIKERVKAAGGNVSGELCCRLAWYNYDDLDLHMDLPNGRQIYFGSRTDGRGGALDVDMNAGSGQTREPVENIYFESIKKMQAGRYRLFVNNWNNRESKDPGFEVEIDMLGQVFSYKHNRAVSQKQDVTVAEFEVKNGKIEMLTKLEGNRSQQDIWGVKTNDFTEVSAIMLSPNFWGENKIGNRHFFFMLEGCENPDTARGFYNEFLRQDLSSHRKVLDVVGAKMQTESVKGQLSGVGFSDTKRDEIVVKVSGAFTRIIKVKI